MYGVRNVVTTETATTTVEEVADDPQGEAERRNDERKLANLSHGETAAHGILQRLAAQEESYRSENGLTDEDGHDDDDYRQGIVDENLRFDEHADRDEEDGSEEVLHRLN